MHKKSKSILAKQKRLLWSALGVSFILIFGIGYFCMSRSSYPAQRVVPKPIELPADTMNPQDIWMSKFETQNNLLDQKIRYLEEIVIEEKKRKENSQREKEQLRDEIASLKVDLAQLASLPPAIKDFPNSSDPFMGSYSERVQELEKPVIPIAEVCMSTKTSSVKNVANVIPAGTSVKALLVSSVDADCGVYSPSNPIPVKLRILDDGHLPKNVDVDLKGGIIIGSAYGNLSSERVYVRLERLTQVNDKGDFVETEVAGYATGEDGKYGIRGTVVDVSEKIIANAALSGLFGEASDIIQAAVGRWRVDTYLSTNQQTGNEPSAPGFGGSGANAFDMLSDYYIRRAEQIEPVIQVGAGRIVDITFTHGADLGDFETQDKVRKVREKYRRDS